MGDFNFHVDVPSDRSAKNFLEIASSFGLHQHVDAPTHIKGHTLDLVLSSPEKGFVRESIVSAGIGGSDHFSVLTTVRVNKPSLPTKSISYRPLKLLNIEEFAAGLRNSTFVTQPANDIDTLIRQYDASVLSALDKHAPVRRKTFILRPYNPWFSKTITAERRLCRRAERKWRKSALTIDAEILRSRQKCLARTIHEAKVTYYKGKIGECAGDKRGLFRLLNSAMLRKNDTRLPQASSPCELAKRFSHFFLDKIAVIRARLDGREGSAPLASAGPSSQRGQFYIFRSASSDEVRSLIMAAPTKSCHLDSLPTHLLKRVVDTLLPSLTLLATCPWILVCSLMLLSLLMLLHY